jgi:hypothetical protein
MNSLLRASPRKYGRSKCAEDEGEMAALGVGDCQHRRLAELEDIDG